MSFLEASVLRCVALSKRGEKTLDQWHVFGGGAICLTDQWQMCSGKPV